MLQHSQQHSCKSQMLAELRMQLLALGTCRFEVMLSPCKHEVVLFACGLRALLYLEVRWGTKHQCGGQIC